MMKKKNIREDLNLVELFAEDKIETNSCAVSNKNC